MIEEIEREIRNKEEEKYSTWCTRISVKCGDTI